MAYPYPRVPHLKACVVILESMNKLIDNLDKHDVYGDLVENFCELDKTSRTTDRLIKMIKQDIKKELNYYDYS